MQPVERAPGEECRFAENNAPFIFNCLKKLKDKMPANEFVYKHGDTKLADIPERRGLYMFYADFGGNGRYPVYIGKTEQGFKTRFARHAKDGVIWRFENGQFPKFQWKETPKLEAVLLTIPLSFTMKLAESMFLCPFDFALNKMENDSKRLEIKKISENTPKFSYERYYKLFLDTVNNQTKLLDDALREN